MRAAHDCWLKTAQMYVMWHKCDMPFVPWTLHIYSKSALKTRLSLCVPPSFLHSLTSHGNNIITILHSHLLHTIIVQLSVGERSQGFNFLPPLCFFFFSIRDTTSFVTFHENRMQPNPRLPGGCMRTCTFIALLKTFLPSQPLQCVCLVQTQTLLTVVRQVADYSAGKPAWFGDLWAEEHEGVC